MPPALASASVASSAVPAVDEDAWPPAVFAAPQTAYAPTEPVGLACICVRIYVRIVSGQITRNY